MSNKEEWRVYPQELANRAKDSVGSVTTGLKELEDAGYIKVYKKNLKKKGGLQHFRFCADRKISQEIFENLKSKLDSEFD